MPPKPKLTHPQYQDRAKSMDWRANAIDKDVKAQVFTDSQLETYRVVPDADGRAVYALTEEPIHTGVLTEENEWMYVVDICGNLFVAKRIKNRVYHSALTGGKNPVAAGRIQIDHGRITFLDEESGHYKLKDHVWIVIWEMVVQGFTCPDDPEVVSSPYPVLPEEQRLEYKQAAMQARLAQINKQVNKS